MIYFLSENTAPNYLTNPEVYSSFSLGKISHIAYYYWILKNNGIDDVALVSDTETITNGDIVFFYQVDFNPTPLPYTKLDIGKIITKIQVTGDTNLKTEADYYAINDPTFIDDKKFYLPFPLPVGLITCQPEWPPRIFGCACHSFNLHPDFRKKKYQRKFEELDIELYLDHKTNHITKNIDVHFFIRNPYINLMFKFDGTKLHPPMGFKHPNRLLQSWCMGTPSIFDTNSAMKQISIGSEYLTADSVDEFVDCVIQLKTDQSLWNKLMTETNLANEKYGNWQEKIISRMETFLLEKLGYKLRYHNYV